MLLCIAILLSSFLRCSLSLSFYEYYARQSENVTYTSTSYLTILVSSSRCVMISFSWTRCQLLGPLKLPPTRRGESTMAVEASFGTQLRKCCQCTCGRPMIGKRCIALSTIYRHCRGS